MNLFERIRNRKAIREQGKIIAALDGFLQQIYLAKSLSAQESRKNLEEGLIEIIHYTGQHAANGVLVTDNGYFLTSRHCAEEGSEDDKIRLYDGSEHSIDYICEVSDNQDLALAKADIPGELRPKTYRFFIDDVPKKVAVVLLTRRDGLIIENYGSFDNYRGPRRAQNWDGKILEFKNHFSFNILGHKPGDSGGIVLSTDSGLMGIWCGGKDIRGSAVSFMDVLNLISSYRERLQQRIS